MLIGCPKEIKNHEYRVGIVPSGVRAFVEAGHKVIVETNAGVGSGITDDEFRHAGAEILKTREEVFSRAEMIIKVKEPQPDEIPMLREEQILYTYLHLAPAPELTRGLLDRKVTGVAYETIQLPDNSLPLLTPMSEIAGRMSIQCGARSLEKESGGRGVLLGGVPGVE
ncbi:MAG TPA: alanine dehydrogenase, partial [bacterium]|nr:alanine dehydrogenase [bacterium]